MVGPVAIPRNNDEGSEVTRLRFATVFCLYRRIADQYEVAGIMCVIAESILIKRLELSSGREAASENVSVYGG